MEKESKVDVQNFWDVSESFEVCPKMKVHRVHSVRVLHTKVNLPEGELHDFSKLQTFSLKVKCLSVVSE